MAPFRRQGVFDPFWITLEIDLRWIRLVLCSKPFSPDSTDPDAEEGALPREAASRSPLPSFFGFLAVT